MNFDDYEQREKDLAKTEEAYRKAYRDALARGEPVDLTLWIRERDAHLLDLMTRGRV